VLGRAEHDAAVVAGRAALAQDRHSELGGELPHDLHRGSSGVTPRNRGAILIPTAPSASRNGHFGPQLAGRGEHRVDADDAHQRSAGASHRARRPRIELRPFVEHGAHRHRAVISGCDPLLDHGLGG